MEVGRHQNDNEWKPKSGSKKCSLDTIETDGFSSQQTEEKSKWTQINEKKSSCTKQSILENVFQETKWFSLDKIEKGSSLDKTQEEKLKGKQLD